MHWRQFPCNCDPPRLEDSFYEGISRDAETQAVALGVIVLDQISNTNTTEPQPPARQLKKEEQQAEVGTLDPSVRVDSRCVWFSLFLLLCPLSLHTSLSLSPPLNLPHPLPFVMPCAIGFIINVLIAEEASSSPSTQPSLIQSSLTPSIQPNFTPSSLQPSVFPSQQVSEKGT